MTLAFGEVCTLLDYLEVAETAQPPLLPADKRDRLSCTIEAWFKSHRNAIDKLDIPGGVALLSTLLPERRPDRVYGLQNTSLSRILSRSLGLGALQARSLLSYKQPGRGDLAECVQRVLERGGPPALPKVALHEVDELLDWLAGQCRFSDSALQGILPSSSEVRDRRLGDVFKRLCGRDAKWLVRLILKDMSPAVLDDRLVLRCFHFLLPDLLHFQQNLSAAVNTLRSQLHLYPSNPDSRSERLLKLNASSALCPLINIKVSRPAFTKARSIEHCLQMLGKHSWVIERKYDGEFAEIHIDMSTSANPAECIKIFSKNGKDSTEDRQGIHDTLIRCLRLGQRDCKIKKQAIILGELVVWSDESRSVMPFEEIRKHVTRSGSSLGTARDARPQNHEHLCIVFFDVLLLDDCVVMSQSVEKRRQVLKSLYTKIPGRVKSAEWKVIRFGQGDISTRRLMEQFAASNAQCCEGLVLKPCGVPYYSIERDPGLPFHGYIKLKKDYIAGLGDEADFAVIGGSYDAQQAAKSSNDNLRWTVFFLGAIMNKEKVIRYGHRPLYKVVGTISQQHCIPPKLLDVINKLAICRAVEYTSETATLGFDIQSDSVGKIEHIFTTPFVFEVLGSGYVKPSNCNFYMLRHARVTKLHQDRTWKDCIGFDELQSAAAESRTSGIDSESQENRKHLARLEATMRKKFERQTTRTPSPRKSAASAALSAPSCGISTAGRLPLAVVASNVQSATPSSGGIAALDGTTVVTLSPLPKKRKAADTMHQPLSVTKRPCLERRLMQKLPRQGLCPSKDSLLQDKAACIASSCFLARAVVYLVPCIAKTPYVSSDLLKGHDTTLTASWHDWIRGGNETKENADTVDESQAYPNLRRIMLVEVNRRTAYNQIIEHLLDKSTHSMKDDCIEIWDWRLLESIKQHETYENASTKHMVGMIRWDKAKGMMMLEAIDRST